MLTGSRRAMTEDDALAMRTLADVAALVCGGHCSVYAFTTNWKACLGTHSLASNPEDELVPSFPTLTEAVAWAVTHYDRAASNPHYRYGPRNSSTPDEDRAMIAETIAKYRAQSPEAAA